MSISLNSASFADSAAIPRQEHPGSNCGQAGWLYQLEHAMLEQSGSAGSQPGRSSQQAAAVRTDATADVAAGNRGLVPGDGAVETGVAWSAHAAFATPLPELPPQGYGATVAGRTLAPEGNTASNETLLSVPLAQARLPDSALVPGRLGQHKAADPAACRSGEMHRPQAGAGNQYTSAKLHLYQDASGVQAWIRDAALLPARAELVALGMARELGMSGARLNAVTLNGKRIVFDTASDTVAPAPACSAANTFKGAV
ncbi:hypothetical protein ACQ4WP_24435 [Janthinobacterium sp. GB4P2]|uniref:hypothetical protein n=1 Tax=Janthinobacterium sp. GB4P2 TaxID=3424189 RepID=UPI003F21823B